MGRSKRRAYKTKLRPTAEQRRMFAGCAGAARFVYNWALADRRLTFESGGKPNQFEQKRRFNVWKLENAPWLAEYPYVLVEYAFIDCDRAFQNFFRRVKTGAEKPGYPRFKNKYAAKKAFGMGQGIEVKAGRVRLPKIGWVNLAEKTYMPECKGGRPANGIKVLNARVSARNGDWYIAIQVEQEMELTEGLSGVLGVDLGVKSLAVTSDGKTYDNPKTLAAHERKLARLQRELSRRVKGSANRTKTKEKIARQHERIAAIRRHNLHNISSDIVYGSQAAIIGVEDLHVKGMMANHSLAKAVADSSMGELKRQIAYKADWIGTQVVEIDRWYASSKTCSECGHIQDMPLNVRTYHCPQCGMVLDRDVNAARNIAKMAAAAVE